MNDTDDEGIGGPKDRDRRPDFGALLDALIDKVYARDGWGDQRAAVVAYVEKLQRERDASIHAEFVAHNERAEAQAELAELKGLYGAAKATITTLSWAKSDAVNLAAELAAERQRADGLRAERDNAHALIKLLSDSKRYCVTENIGHDWVPVEVSVLAGMKRCPICGTSWSGSGTPDVCPTPHLHKAMPRLWRCKVCGLSERVHRMSGHPSRNHKPQMELTDANRNEVTTAAGNSNRDESRRGGS